MIRLLTAPAAHREAVLYLAQAAAAGPPWLAIALAAIATLSAVGVASAPALVERVKRGKTPTPATATPPAIEGSVNLVQDAFDDVRRERDEAQDEARNLAAQLTAANRVIAERDIEIAKLAARVDALVDRFGRGPT